MSTPPSSDPQPPKHLVERAAEFRAKAATVGLTLDEDAEYGKIRRVLDAYEQASARHATRVAYDRNQTARLREFEADAQELRERAEYLQGIRKEPPVPRKQVFMVKIRRPSGK